MIIVDIQVPSINKVYDFELDEEMMAGALVKEVAEIVAEKEKMIYRQEDQMYLFAMEHEKVLNENCSLRQQGIRNGERLILI